MASIQLDVMLSEKGKTLLLLDNYKFRFHKYLVNNIQRWACVEKSCASYIKVNENLIMVDSNINHKHEGTPESCLARQKLRNSVKRKAIEDIFAEVRTNVNDLIVQSKTRGKEINVITDENDYINNIKREKTYEDEAEYVTEVKIEDSTNNDIKDIATNNSNNKVHIPIEQKAIDKNSFSIEEKRKHFHNVRQVTAKDLHDHPEICQQYVYKINALLDKKNKKLKAIQAALKLKEKEIKSLKEMFEFFKEPKLNF